MRKSSVLRVQPAAHHQNGGLHLPGEGQLLPAVDAVVREVALRYPAAPEDDGGFGDLFGTRVAIHGNKILVSSLKNDGGATDAGAAYVFEKDSISGWIQTARLGNPDPTSFDLFASDVDMYNDTILIGVRHDDDKGSSSGSAYLYEWTGSDWVVIEKLLASDGAADDNYGYEVGLWAEIAVVGAYGKDVEGIIDAGKVYIYQPALPEEAPVADSGFDQLIVQGSQVTLDASGSYDPDLDYPLTYDWYFVSIPTGSQAVLTGADTANPTFYADVPGDYVVELVVTDALGLASEPDQVVITAINNLPLAYAGENVSLASEDVAATVILGSASDADPADELEYRWLAGEAVLLDWTPVESDGTCPLELFGLPLELGTHALTLEVTDGFDIAADDMLLTIENSAPHAGPAGAGVYEVNTDVILGGFVSDFDGDLLEYRWRDGSTLLYMDYVAALSGGDPVPLEDFFTSSLALGLHTITLEVDDGVNDPVSGAITVEIVDTTVPVLAPVADRTILWPPNHQLVEIVIEANAYDNSGLPVTLSVVISSNEPVDGLGDDDLAPDWTEPVIDPATGIITFYLRSERSGSGNGRIYTVAVTATDDAGNQSTVNVPIIVPHDKSTK